MSAERQPHTSHERSLLYVPSLELLEKAAAIPCGTPDTYGATPLDHSLAYQQQTDLLENLRELVETDIPEDIPQNIVEYMKDTFSVRFYSRGIANHENYLSALHSCDEFADNPVVSDMLSRAKVGFASPAELLLVRKILGIRSAELACLTHPYGKRLEDITTMRKAVRDSVLLLGGTYDKEPETRYRAKAVVNWQMDFSQGFFMTRKRTLGRLPDGTIIRERTSFILRTDENGAVPQQNLEAINNCSDSGSWQDVVVRAGRLDEIADGLLEADAFTLVIPISTTIYAFNPETAALVAVRGEVEKELRRRDLAVDFTQYPELHKLEEQRKQNRRIKNVGNMFFVGPEDDDSDE